MEIEIKEKELNVIYSDILVNIKELENDRWIYIISKKAEKDHKEILCAPFESTTPFNQSRYKDSLLTHELIKTMLSEKEETKEFIKEMTIELFKISEKYYEFQIKEKKVESTESKDLTKIIELNETPMQRAKRLLKEKQNNEKLELKNKLFKEKQKIENEKLELKKLKDIEKKERDEEKQEQLELHNNLTKEVESISNFVAIQNQKDYPIYIYRNGIYEDDGEAFIRKYLSNTYPYIHTGNFEEVVKRIRQKNLEPFSKLDSDKSKIVMLNGVYNLKTEKFEEHSPKNYSTIQIPINYDANAQCPKIHKYFTEIVEPEYVSTLYEKFGYLLFRGNPFKKIFFLVGDNNSSKSTYLSLMRNFIGQKYISAMEIQKIASDNYSAAELRGKVINMCADSKSKDIKDTATIKTLSGDTDLIHAERKFGGHFDFMYDGKLIFGFNILPNIPEDEMDFFADRIFIINFPNKFEKKEGFLNSIITPEEMSGLFNMSIEGLKRAMKNRCLTNTLSREEIIEQYATLAEPITKFVFEAFDVDITKYVVKENLFYTIFKNYINKNNARYSGTEDKFWKDLKNSLTLRNSDLGYNERKTIDGKQQYVITGFVLKPEYNITEEQEPNIPEEQDPEWMEENKINIDITEEQEQNFEIEIPIGITEEEQEDPKWFIQGFESESEYNHYVSLIEDNDKSVMDLYEELFEHIYTPEETIETDETPELTEEAFKRQEVELERHCSKCDKNLSPDYKLKICKECLEIINKPRIKEVEKVEYCKKCGTGLINNICYQCKTKIIKASHSLFATEVNIDKSIQEE